MEDWSASVSNSTLAWAAKFVVRGGIPAILIAFAAAGCAHRRYEPTALPAAYTAKPTVGSRSVDLSKFPRTAMDSRRVYPGDLLEVAVITGVESRAPDPWVLRVDEQGYVDVPNVGAVRIAQMRFSESEQLIRRVAVQRGVYVDPKVSVVLKERRSVSVTVVGEVEEPGVYEIPAASADLISAVTAAGGFTKEADTIVNVSGRRVEIAREGDDGDGRYVGYGSRDPAVATRTVSFNLASAEPRSSEAYRLDDGATVMVKKRPPQKIHVLGLVKKPGSFDLPDDQPVRVLDALAMAGGRTLQIADKVYVIRKPTPPAGEAEASGEEIVIEVSVRAAKGDKTENLLLAAGDVVSVEETPVTFAVDFVRSVVGFGFSARFP